MPLTTTVRFECGLCDDRLLRHFHNQQICWFCPTCRQYAAYAHPISLSNPLTDILPEQTRLREAMSSKAASPKRKKLVSRKASAKNVFLKTPVLSALLRKPAASKTVGKAQKSTKPSVSERKQRVREAFA
ncbi:MAG: hypothetical protein AAFR58_02250 [Cyanobacteria bacterium J06627_28]